MNEKNTFYKVDCVEVLDGILSEKMVFRFNKKLLFITSWNKTQLFGRELLNLEDRNKMPEKEEKSFNICDLIEDGLEVLSPHKNVVTCRHCGTILQWGDKEIKHVYDACECVEGIFCDNCSSHDGVCIICNEDEEDFEEFWAGIAEDKINGKDVLPIIEDKIKLCEEYFLAQNETFNNLISQYIKNYICDFIDCEVSFKSNPATSFDEPYKASFNVKIKDKESHHHTWMRFRYKEYLWEGERTDYSGISETVHCVSDSYGYIGIVVFSEICKALLSGELWTTGAEYWACDPDAVNPRSIDFDETIKVIKLQQKFYRQLTDYKKK